MAARRRPTSSTGTSRRRPEQAVGGRHHLHADLGRLSLPGRRARCVQPADRRLGDGDAPCAPSSCSSPSTWRSGSAGRRRRSTTRTKALSTLDRLRQAMPRGRRSAPRWARSATATIMRCARASSPPSNASCSTDAASSTQAEARMAVFEFIEGFYNPRRRHSSLGYLSPIDTSAATTESGSPPAPPILPSCSGPSR